MEVKRAFLSLSFRVVGMEAEVMGLMGKERSYGFATAESLGH